MASKKIWYVEGFGHTNEVIARELPEENAHKGNKNILCIDGIKRDLWQCDYSFIAKLIKNKQSLQLDFKVRYRDGPNGPVREWPFTKKPTLANAVKRGMLFKMPSQKINPVS